MKKKIVFLGGLILSLLFVMISVGSNVYQVNAASYVAGGDCGKNAKWYLTKDGELHVYGTGDMTNYGSWDYNKKPWVNYEDEILQVIIEDGITSVGRDCFCLCKNLTTLKLADSVKTIDAGAFHQDPELTNITWSKNIEKIGDTAFENCPKIKSVKFTNKLKTLGMSAFHKTGLTSVEIPSSVTYMEGYTFMECKDLKTVIVDCSVDIPYECFMDDTALKTVTIGSHVKGISVSAFRNCSDLKNVTFEEGLTTILEGAFQDCTSLKEIKFPDSLTTTRGWNWMGVFKNDTALETIVFGKGFNYFAGSLVEGCTNLKKLYFAGDAPKYEKTDVFDPSCVITAYYPYGNSTWDFSALVNHGADVDWLEWKVTLDHFATSVSLIENTADGISLKWSKLSGATKYEVYRQVNNGEWKRITTLAKTKYTDKNVKAGNMYSYKIVAINKKYEADPSAIKSMVYLKGTSLSSAKYSNYRMSVVAKNAKDVTGYEIEYGQNKKFYSASSKKSTSPTFDVSGLKKGTYYVHVRTYKTVNNVNYVSPWSKAVTVTVK